jgi:cysteine synthase
MFVAGAGTGGTLTGVAMKIKQRCPNCKVIVENNANKLHASWLQNPIKQAF